MEGTGMTYSSASGENDEVKSVGSALFLTGFGGYEKMAVVAITCPVEVAANQVIVHIKANGIQFADLMVRQGLHDLKPQFPVIIGMEGSGDVIMVGKGVTKFKVGDRVTCVSHSGLWSEFACIQESLCFVIPESMSYVDAAAIPINFVTAYHMLFNFGGLHSGQSVLIHMAAGGVGTAAIQLCKTVHKVTVFGTASASKHDAIRQLGVDHPIDYRTRDYAEEIRRISPEGVDIVLDPLNGADAAKGYELLKPFGKIIHFGAANLVSGPSKSYWNILKTYLGMKSYSPFALMQQNRAVCGYRMGFLIKQPALIESALKDVFLLYQQGKIKPQIDSVWAYSDISKAMARMHDRLNVGKVIIVPRRSSEDEVNKK